MEQKFKSRTGWKKNPSAAAAAVGMMLWFNPPGRRYLIDFAQHVPVYKQKNTIENPYINSTINILDTGILIFSAPSMMCFANKSRDDNLTANRNFGIVFISNFSK